MEIKLKPINLVFNEGRHTYLLEGKSVPGASSISGILPKPWMAPWASKLAVETVAQFWKAGKKYDKEEIAQYLSLAKGAHTIRKNVALTAGTDAHAWFEAFIKTGTEPPIPEDTEVANSIEAFRKWRDSHEIEWLLSEVIVGSITHQVAGKLDSVALIDGKLTLVDFKTSKAIYKEEYYIQTALYKMMLEEMGCPVIEQRLILRVPKDESGFEAHIVESDYEADKEAAISAIQVYNYLKKFPKEWIK